MCLLAMDRSNKKSNVLQFRWPNTIITLLILNLCFNWIHGACTGHPQCNLTTAELIKMYGYPAEEHRVKTSDGYVLALQRIPRGIHDDKAMGYQERPPILILHGLLSSSTYFVVNGPGYALALVLADAGYDVWLGNDRSNFYSRKNVYYKVNNPKFWRFSADDIFLTDVPTMIDYVLSQKTQIKQIYMIGYSMGTLNIMGCLSGRSEYNKKLLFATFYPLHDVFPTPGSYQNAKAEGFCSNETTKSICSSIELGLIESKYINQSWTPVYWSTYPAGSSTYVFDHFIQILKAKKLVRYRYTEDKYNRNPAVFFPETEYDVQAINTPITLFFSKSDGFATEDVVGFVKKQLGDNVVGEYAVDELIHADFVYSHRAKEVVYDVIIKILKSDSRK